MKNNAHLHSRLCIQAALGITIHLDRREGNLDLACRNGGLKESEKETKNPNPQRERERRRWPDREERERRVEREREREVQRNCFFL